MESETFGKDKDTCRKIIAKEEENKGDRTPRKANFGMEARNLKLDKGD